MSYFAQEDLEALIPRPWLVEGLNDDVDAVETEDIEAAAALGFAKVQALAENEVNGVLGSRYAVPLDVSGAANAGLAAFLKTLCVLIGVETVYERRGREMLKSRVEKLKNDRVRLASIAKGTDPLSPSSKPVNTPGLVFSEDSRVYSESVAA